MDGRTPARVRHSSSQCVCYYIAAAYSQTWAPTSSRCASPHTRYDFVKVRVWLGESEDRHVTVLSRFVLCRTLTAAKARALSRDESSAHVTASWCLTPSPGLQVPYDAAVKVWPGVADRCQGCKLALHQSITQCKQVDKATTLSPTWLQQ
jgi:hypothetical protein